jgi:cell division transport system permease protein
MRIDGVDTPDFTDLRQKLASIVPDAHLEGGGQLLAGWRAEAYRLSGGIAAFIALAFLVSVSAALSHARSTLVLHRDELELLYLLGAPDNGITRRFAGATLLLGSPGACAGAIAAALTLLALGGAPVALHLSSFADVVGISDWRIWVILAGAAIAGAAVPVALARGMVRRRLAQMA